MNFINKYRLLSGLDPIPHPILEYTGNSAIIGFFLPPEVSQKLVISGGTPIDEMHITLVSLGEKENLPPGAAQSALEICKSYARSTSSVFGHINGIARFSGNGTSTSKDPLVALVDIPELSDFRSDLIRTLERGGVPVNRQHGFTPHITLAYIDKDAPIPIQRLDPVGIKLDTITIAIAGKRTNFTMTRGLLDELLPY